MSNELYFFIFRLTIAISFVLITINIISVITIANEINNRLLKIYAVMLKLLECYEKQQKKKGGNE